MRPVVRLLVSRVEGGWLLRYDVLLAMALLAAVLSLDLAASWGDAVLVLVLRLRMFFGMPGLCGWVSRFYPISTVLL